MTTNSSPPPYSTSLPIIEHLVQAYIFWSHCVPHFPKVKRYTLGAKIEWAFLETTEAIFAAKISERHTKLPYLDKAANKLDLLKFLLQVAWQVKSLDNKKYISLSQQLDEIGRMLGGWRKNCNKKLPPARREQEDSSGAHQPIVVVPVVVVQPVEVQVPPTVVPMQIRHIAVAIGVAL